MYIIVYDVFSFNSNMHQWMKWCKWVVSMCVWVCVGGGEGVRGCEGMGGGVMWVCAVMHVRRGEER